MWEHIPLLSLDAHVADFRSDLHAPPRCWRRQSDPRSASSEESHAVTTCLCPACQRPMWSSKMAARWRSKDGDLNAGNSDFLARNTPNQVLCRRDAEAMEMDAQSCVDHSILAIFEDSTVAAEDKSGVVEESETLLSALTEMLDSVEDDDRTLSPFDTLPDTKLLTHPELRDNSVDLLLADRLRPRSKSTNVTFAIQIDGEKRDESKIEQNSPPQPLRQQSPALFQSKNKKAEAEVEVFTSTSLVNLVKIMHSYCLKLHVEEEGDKLRRNISLFSQEEVWKYERPTEESDEEINVVSDDEAAVKETKERDDGKLLKSVLLKGSSSRDPASREKKRVSFGPVQVASFDELAEKNWDEKTPTSGHRSETVSVQLSSTKALENPAISLLEPQTASSEMNNQAAVSPPKAEAKVKSLSLQQYRQLRQKRQPLVEKQGNYTTKWPSVSEPPTELTPILCLQGQRHHYPDGRRNGTDLLHRSQTPGYKTQRTLRSHPSEVKPFTPPCRSGLKRQRIESKIISPASPLPDVTAHPNVTLPESKRSPVKKPTLISSDPPNPVFLSLPVIQTTQPSIDNSSSKSKVEFLDNTRHFQEIQNECLDISLPQQPSSLGPKPEDCTLIVHEMKFAEIASGISSRQPALCTTTAQSSSSQPTELQPHKCCPGLTKNIKLEPKAPQSQSLDTGGQTVYPSFTPNSSQLLTAVEAPVPVKETSPEVHTSKFPPEDPLPLQISSAVQSATAGPGIEAADLTSLLEQFEETQAKEERVKPKLVCATSPPSLQADEHLDLAEPAESGRGPTLPLTPPVETLKPLNSSDSHQTPKPLRNSPQLQTSEHIPEPLGTEIILSTQQDFPARRKNPPTKAIQIIDPRPLPSKKTHSNLSELPAAVTSPHVYASICSDHDYCGSVDSLLTSATQRSRAYKLKDVSKTTDKLQASTQDSSAAAAECKNQTATIIQMDNSAKSVTQHPVEEARTRSGIDPSTDKVLSLSDSATTEQDCGSAAQEKTAPCTLPTPPPSPPARGRDKRKYRRTSPRSDSSSSSCSSSSSSSSSSASPSPRRQKRCRKRSASSSCTSSPSRSMSRSPPRRCRWSYSRSRWSRSRSRSWSQSRSPSRSRSPSPRICRRQWRDVYSSRESRRLRREQKIRSQKLKAIDERRVVYVGRICRSMTHDELRERFSMFGEVECVSLHFRERGDHYGFVTFYNMDDAFRAIDNGGKLRRPNELPFDLCFGGRRQFCNSNYADLDANRDEAPSPAKSRFEDLDFDSLLKQAQRGLKR